MSAFIACPPTYAAESPMKVFEHGGFDDDRYLGCFEAGYAWGREMEITWLYPSDAAVAAMREAPSGSSPGSMAHAFDSCLLELADSMAIEDDRPGFGTADEAFDASSDQLSAGMELAPDSARSAFHVGSAFVAFETQLLMSHRTEDRIRSAFREVERQQRPIDSIVVFLNLLLALGLGAVVVWLGHVWLDSWWTLIATIPIALAILASWARWSEWRETDSA